MSVNALAAFIGIVHYGFRIITPCVISGMTPLCGRCSPPGYWVLDTGYQLKIQTPATGRRTNLRFEI